MQPLLFRSTLLHNSAAAETKPATALFTLQSNPMLMLNLFRSVFDRWKHVLTAILALLVALLLLSNSMNSNPVVAKPTTSFQLYKSIDEGQSWAAVGSGLSQTSRINALAISGDKAYAGTDDGILVSTDEGAIWTRLSLASSLRVQAIVAVEQQVFAGTKQAGVSVSKDGGRSWSQLTSGLTDLNIRSLARLGPSIYAGTDTLGVFVLEGGASEWKQFGSGLPEHAQIFDLAVSGQSVYAALYSKGLYRLNASGGRWGKVGDVTPLEFLVQGNTLLAGHNPGGVFRSSDDGMTWSLASGISDQAPIWVLGNAGSNLLAGTSPGGVPLSRDLGATWETSAAGLPAGAAVVTIGSSKRYTLAAISK